MKQGGSLHFRSIYHYITFRANIYLEIGTKNSSIEDIQWYTDKLIQQKKEAPKAILFCR